MTEIPVEPARPRSDIGDLTTQRAAVLKRLRNADVVFRLVTRAAMLAVLLLLGGVILALIDGAMPALKTFGFGFLVTEAWNPVTEKFGALAPIYGTLATSIIAMLIAVPLGLLIAVFLTELCPIWLRRPIGIAVELLAGIPSIIYGIWGLFVLAPFLQRTLQPALIGLFGPVPILSNFFAGPPYGIGVLTAGLVLAIVVLPYARVGVVGGVMLGLGRALGETMAVTFVIGNAHRISASILAPGTTISAAIANEFTEADGELYTASLIALGLILFAITFVVLAIARIMLARIEHRVR
jgi:phosphate transport system permease protein